MIKYFNYNIFCKIVEIEKTIKAKIKTENRTNSREKTTTKKN